MEQLVQAEGREITLLRLPPYHCEFNPIEKVWFDLKHFLQTKNPTNLKTVIALAKDYFADIALCEKNLPAYFHHACTVENSYFEKEIGSVPA